MQSAYQPQANVQDEMLECIKNCLECYGVCEAAVVHSLESGGDHAQISYIQLMRDCAEICRVHANLLVRGSEFRTRLSPICGEIATRAATNTEAIMGDDELLKACVDVCRRCADSCEKMTYSSSALGATV